MAEQIRLLDPQELRRNPENPRLIFRTDELEDLQASIAAQGILVPLTVYRDGRRFYLLDGERRWRCALKLGLPKIPAIIQPKPDRLQNIMMMFAIHNARKDWDPLPTALKLREIEKEFQRRNGRLPTEVELSGLASLSRGEVRRLKKLLNLPASYRKELLAELEKPKSKQEITVDHVLETTKGAEALQKRGIISPREEDSLRQAILAKFRKGVIRNTVDPRKLARLARSVERGEVSRSVAKRVVTKLIEEPKYSIDDAFHESVEQVDYEHSLDQLAGRLITKLDEHENRGYTPSEKLLTLLKALAQRLARFRKG